MSKFQIVKGIIDNLEETPYTEGKVYFTYDNVESQNITIYADIDGVRRKIKEGVQRDELNNYLLKTDIANWAKASAKPTYTASEVGALSTSHPAANITTEQITQWNNKSNFSGSYNDLTEKPPIPTRTSDLTNDSGFLTEETDPTVPAWAKTANKPTYTAEEVGAVPFDASRAMATLKGNPSTLRFASTNTANQYVQAYVDTNSASITLQSRYNSGYPIVSNVKLKGIASPQDSKDAANKDYVDSAVSDKMTSTEVNSAIATAIGNINQFNVAIVSTLPTENIDNHTIYFMSNGGSNDDIYDEWMYINNNWEKIGATSIDLSGYMQTSHPANGITSADITNWNSKSDTDELVKQEYNNSSSNYPVLLSPRYQDTTITSSVYKNTNVYVSPREGFLHADKLQVGSVAQSGYISLGKNVFYGTNSGADSYTITLPAASGTVALTSDIPTVPTKVSDLTNDSGFISSYTETDPVFSASVAAGITSTDISNWNAKSNTDEKVKTEEYSTADSTGHPIVLGKTSAASITESKYATTNLTFYINDSNYYTLKVGSEGRAKGRIWINSGDGNTSNGTFLITSAKSNRIVTLPDKAGTVALTSDIPDTSSFVSNITYDATNRELKQAINGTTSTIVDFGTAAFKLVTTTISSNSSNLPTAGAVIEYVDNKIPKVYSSTNTTGYLTMDTLPIYNGTVV